jgi:hypothetical protein
MYVLAVGCSCRCDYTVILVFCGLSVPTFGPQPLTVTAFTRPAGCAEATLSVSRERPMQQPSKGSQSDQILSHRGQCLHPSGKLKGIPLFCAFLQNRKLEGH